MLRQSICVRSLCQPDRPLFYQFAMPEIQKSTKLKSIPCRLLVKTMQVVKTVQVVKTMKVGQTIQSCS